ncbi:MAG: ABC-F family ATP-binding cassette domain-containing protein [Paracoccus sp. (in: a-proteobacteria)]
MARAPILQLTDISLTFGGNSVFEGLNLTVQLGDRLALVGRNGSGKSTLMKVMAGLVEPDKGEIVTPAGVSVGYMEQDPDLSGFATLGDFASASLPPGEAYRVEIAAEGLKFDSARPVETASGGERRRAALARLLAEAPDLMLLDEPTNHLDIEAIGWLEEQLSQASAAFVLISHDRAFLRALTRATLWIDRGEVRRQDKGFEAFEDWRETTWAAEDEARHKLDRKIRAESRWAVEGISARRKRNMGRVRALQELRAERAAQIRRQGTAAMELDVGPQSGKRVIEARGIAKSFAERNILKPFDLRVMRGDRVAFVGPNGVGKTTLIKMLTGDIIPDQGSVTHGTNLEIAVFDQARSAIDPALSLWDAITTDPSMAVSGRSDQVMVRGTPRHVVGYLKDFLFDESQVRAPVRSLSGGEKARLLLARIMARPSNLLVLDEPTNDLDVETLDLLQDILGDYDGTVLLVSHDRDFIDRVAGSTVAMEGDGRAVVYPGGWSDYRAQRPEQAVAATISPVSRRKPEVEPVADKQRVTKPGLSFTERHRFDELPSIIARLEAEITKLSEFLSDASVYTDSPARAQNATDALTERQAVLDAAEEEWLLLAEKAD